MQVILTHMAAAAIARDCPRAVPIRLSLEIRINALLDTESDNV